MAIDTTLLTLKRQVRGELANRILVKAIFDQFLDNNFMVSSVKGHLQIDKNHPIKETFVNINTPVV